MNESDSQHWAEYGFALVFDQRRVLLTRGRVHINCVFQHSSIV